MRRTRASTDLTTEKFEYEMDSNESPSWFRVRVRYRVTGEGS